MSNTQPAHKIQDYVNSKSLQELVALSRYLYPKVRNLYWDTDFEELEKNTKKYDFIQECIRMKKGGRQTKLKL